MPIIPAVDFISQYYIPLVERIKLINKDKSSQIYPDVWIFSSNDVDSLCTTNIIVNQLFKFDDISCLLNCVTHYNEISRILDEYKNHHKQRESVKTCILINLGAMVNILRSLRIWFGEDVEFWIFDFHRPAIDDITMNNIDGFDNNILIISIQEYNYLINNKERRKKSRKENENIFGNLEKCNNNDTSSSINNPYASLSQTIDDIDILMGTSNAQSEHYSENIDENELFGEYCGDPSSLVILQTLDNSLTSDRIDGDIIWYSSIGISWCYLNRYIELLQYELCFDLINGILSKYVNCQNNSKKSNYNKKYWPKYIKNDISLPLYRHWNLLDSVNNCEYLFTKMNLWKSENTRDIIMNGRILSGISLKDFTGKFCLLDKDLSKKIINDFSKGFSNFESDTDNTLTLKIPTFIKYIPSISLDSEIYPHLSSYDMALILHTLLTNDCRFLENNDNFLDIFSSNIFNKINKKDKNDISNINDYFNKENILSNQILGKEHKMELMFRDNYRVGLQLLDLSKNSFNIVTSFLDYSLKQFKYYIEETKYLLNQRFKYVKMLLSANINGGTLIKHNYFTLAEFNDIEISHPYNLRLIAYSIIDIICKSQDLRGKFVIINKNNVSKIATIVGITPGYDINTPNFFGSIFSKVIDILIEENQGFSNEDHYFVQDEFDFSILRIHNNILDQFTSNLFKYIESNKQIFNGTSF